MTDPRKDLRGGSSVTPLDLGAKPLLDLWVLNNKLLDEKEGW